MCRGFLNREQISGIMSTHCVHIVRSTHCVFTARSTHCENELAGISCNIESRNRIDVSSQELRRIGPVSLITINCEAGETGMGATV